MSVVRGSDRWAVVLAGGDGTRLQGLTTTAEGAVPKQYCSVTGGPSLLQNALRRTRVLVGGKRVALVVAAAHERWWRRDGAPRLAARMVVQPANRGTAAGVLLPLLAVLERDRHALVGVFPADHFFAREGELTRAARIAFGEARRHPSTVVLVGIEPEEVEPDLGWIVPATAGRASAVAGFAEKPGREAALRLRDRGALLSSFVFAVRGVTLLALFRELLPEVSEPLLAWQRCRRAAELAAVYRRLPERDFSRDLLQRAIGRLRVVRSRPCGWTDLGTPERVARCVREGSPGIRWRPGGAHRAIGVPPRIDLATQLLTAGRVASTSMPG